MPYTARSRRRWDLLNTHAGDLAWQIAALMEDYRQKHGDSFQTFGEIDAANRAAGREFERQVINPYESAKLVENGPVFAPIKRRA